MRRLLLGSLTFSSFVVAACGGSEPPPSAPLASATQAPPGASASAAPSASAAVAPMPTAEDKKTAEARKKLEDERTAWQAEHKAELLRWTPEMHATAKTIADKAYPSLDAAMRAAMAGPQRKPGNAERDKYRHPLETMTFFGLKPTMTVLEVGPGEGWYTELLAPVLAAKGKLIATNSDPGGPEDQRSTFYGQRFKAFLDKAPEVFGKVDALVVDSKAPTLPLDGTVDEAIVAREVHGWVNSGTLDAWLSAIHKALKPDGVLGIEEHRAIAGADPIASAKNGYVPEKWLVDHVESAGFKLAGKSEINANPKDTKDYPAGVWALPPALQLGDKDREKYVSIGESDRMTLKFVKTREKAAPTATAPQKAR